MEIVIELYNSLLLKKGLVIDLGIIQLLVVLLLIFSPFILLFYLWKKNNNQKELFQNEFNIINDKNKQLTDSLKYAKIIQKAILPSHLNIHSYFKKAFIIHMPKEHVSGDFVWYGKGSNAQVFALVDCTGHGVPAAFMSIIGNYLLNTIIVDYGIISPSRVLKNLDILVKKEFEREHENPGMIEGMDIAICTFNDNKLIYSGAYMPMIFAREGECTLYKGTKYPLGGYIVKRKKVFVDIEIELQKNDRIYIISDGFYDQFGGNDHKPLRLRNLIKHIQKIQSYTLPEQEEYFLHFIQNWMKDHDQIDDITMVGIEI